MKRLAQAVSALALAATILPAFLFFTDRLPLDSMKTWMLLSTVLWFATAPMWIQIKPK
jgi:hypothetical protein